MIALLGLWVGDFGEPGQLLGTVLRHSYAIEAHFESSISHFESPISRLESSI
jgi:hypothetical protein